MTNIKPKIKIGLSPTPHPDKRVFHATSEVSLCVLKHFIKPLWDSPDSEEKLRNIGGIGRILIEELFTIIGISEVFIDPYSIQVVKGSAFDLEDIEPEVITALKRTFGPEAEKVEIVYIMTEVKANKDMKENLSFNSTGNT